MAPRSLFTALLVAAAGCTIEGSRQLDDECIMTRECASPLRCEITASGVSRCVAPTRLDVPVTPAKDAVVDVAPDVPPPPPPPPPPDVPPPPPDVAPVMDAPRDTGTLPDRLGDTGSSAPDADDAGKGADAARD